MREEWRKSEMGALDMKLLGFVGKTNLFFGVLLFALRVLLWTVVPFKDGLFLKFVWIILAVFYPIIGLLLSLVHIPLAWKKLRLLSFLPLLSAIFLTYVAIVVPGFLIPHRDIIFFEKHFSEYHKTVQLLTESGGHEEPCARRELPAELKHLSVDGAVHIHANKDHINYVFHYDTGINYFEGVAFAPGGHFVIPPERINEAIKGHDNWYYVGD